MILASFITDILSSPVVILGTLLFMIGWALKSLGEAAEKVTKVVQDENVNDALDVVSWIWSIFTDDDD